MTRSRLVSFAALAIAAVAVFLLLSGGEPYRIKAQFVDAGQLVKGGSVQIGGRVVGTIDAIKISDDGLADLELSIDDTDVTPLRRGTIARLRPRRGDRPRPVDRRRDRGRRRARAR